MTVLAGAKLRFLSKILFLIFPLIVFGKTLNVDTLTAPTTNGDLTLNADGTGEVVTSFPFVIGGTSNDASAIFQVDSTTQGVLPPRMTTAQKNAISTPLEGLVLYDSDLETLAVRTSSAWDRVILSGGNVKSAKITDGSATTTVSEDNDNLINGNCTNTNDLGDYTCTFQNAYASAPHCWVQNNGDNNKTADLTTTTTTVSIQWRSTCGPITSWPSPTTSWTSNITWTGYYQQCGNQVEFWLKGAPSATVGPSTGLTITLPNSWTVDTSALSTYIDTEMGTLGIASYHDTGATISASGQRVGYGSTTTVRVFNYNDTSNCQWQAQTGCPIVWANGDEAFINWKVPITGLSNHGPGIDNDFKLFCKAQ